MSEIVDLTGLKIPEQNVPDETSFDVRPKFIQQWIKSLPMANLGETSRLVFKAIVEINRLEMPLQQRFKALESLREPCKYISESLEKHFAGRPLPLNPRNRKISELARALMSELAVGYKIVARQVEASPRPDLKLLIITLHRVMSYLDILLLRSYQVYAPYPRGVWLELHTIYNFADSYQLLEQNIKDPYSKTPASNTISHLYNKISLLALAMPFRLHRGEVDKVCNLLDQLVDTARLEKISDDNTPHGLFIINLHEDKQPGYLAMHRGHDYLGCRLLNTQRLVKIFGQRLSDDNDSLHTLASNDLLQRLLTSWSVMSKRSFSRVPKQSAHVEVAFGLSAAHHFVSGEQPFAQLPSETNPNFDEVRSQYHTTKIESISDEHRGPDVWNMNYTYSPNDPTLAPAATSELSSGSNVHSLEYQTIRLGMANVSAGGYCLISEDDTQFSAQVGDLLAVREYEDRDIDQWGIGVIRRLQSSRKENIELGIQMLTPNAIAVSARLELSHGAGKNSDYLRCLMLPELRAIDQPATIITPAMPFKPEQKIRINFQDKQVIAQLTQRLETTRSFSQFEFKVLEEKSHSAQQQEETSKQASLAESDEIDFESIWSSL